MMRRIAPVPSRRPPLRVGTALLAACWAVSALFAGAPAQAQTDFEKTIEILAADTKDQLGVQLQLAEQQDKKISTAFVLPAKNPILRTRCEPMSGQVQRMFLQRLLEKVSGSRLDEVQFSARQSVDEGDFAIQLNWSRRDDRTIQIDSSIGFFTRDNALMRSGGTGVVRIDSLPTGADACINLNNQVRGTCRADFDLYIEDSPTQPQSRPVVIPSGKTFRVLAASEDGRSLMVSYLHRDEHSSEENDFRGFLTEGVASLQDWGDGRGGQCSGVRIPQELQPRQDAWSDTDRFRDCETCPYLRAIPAGEIFIGSPRDETGRNPDENGTDLPIALSRRIAFTIYEVTWQEWMECVEAGKCTRPVQRAERNPRDLPVSMSFDDAEVFAAWLSEKTGQRYRLPSEAEWEYAARGVPYADLGQRQPRYHWGDVMLPRHAVCLGCGAEPKAHPVFPSDRPANAFGLHDMHGNLWEWVADCWAEHHLPNEDGTPRGAGRPCATPERVIKGGSYLDDPLALRIANRHHAPETEAHAAIGLRLVREHASNR